VDHFLRHPFVHELMSLRLDVSNFAIAGSGPIFARGWIDDPGDIDIVARRSAWRTAAEIGEVAAAPYSDARRISLFDGHVDVYDGWFPHRWSVDSLIDEADFLGGLRFVRLDIIAATKRMLDRPRDLLHLRIVAEHTRQAPCRAAGT
jgi:hypothetical protein